MTERRCVDCVNYRISSPRSFPSDYVPWERCALGHPLKPCPDYQREPGADDDKERAT